MGVEHICTNVEQACAAPIPLGIFPDFRFQSMEIGRARTLAQR